MDEIIIDKEDNIKQERKEHFGTLGERTLHAALKKYYEPNENNHEKRFMGCIVDILNDNGVTEIQTGNFHFLKKKLDKLLDVTNVHIIYPAARTKWLIWVNPETGETTKRRRSPKTGSPYSIFSELFWIKDYLKHPNFNISVIMVDIDEYKKLDGWSRDKKHGSTRVERIPVFIGDEIKAGGIIGYKNFIPDMEKEFYNTKIFAKAASISKHDAQSALNLLYNIGEVTRCGRDKNGYIYKNS